MYIFRLPSRVRVQQNTLGRPLLVKHGPSCLKFIRVSCFRYSKPLFSTNRNEGESATPPGTEEKDETYIKKLQDVANQFSFRSFEQQQPEADSNLVSFFLHLALFLCCSFLLPPFVFTGYSLQYSLLARKSGDSKHKLPCFTLLSWGSKQKKWCTF